MSYIGNPPAEAYTNTVKDTFSGDGSTTAFTMSQISLTNDVRVVVENVVQDPTVAYSCAGTTLTFTSAPPTGTNNIYVVHLGPAVMTALPPAEIAQATTFNSNVSVGGNLTVDTNTLYVDSTNNRVGVGTSSPDIKFHVSGGNARIAGTETSGSFIDINASNTGSDGATLGVSYYGSGSYGPLKFSTGGSERIRVDASGNLLVDTTSTTIVGSGGLAAKPQGSGVRLDISNSGGAAMLIDRRTNDGDIITLYKDGSGVGSIGVNSGRLLQRSTGDASGLRFDGSGYTPFKNGSQADGTVDLGYSGGRYKDVYLSGGVYLGGVVGANKLDDYEEGTFTITLKGAATNPSTTQSWTSYYTKIGRNVTIFVPGSTLLNATGASGYVYFDGLPFAASQATTGTVMSYNGGNWTGSDIVSYVSGSSIFLYQNTSSGAWATISHVPSASVYYVMNITYFVA